MRSSLQYILFTVLLGACTLTYGQPSVPVNGELPSAFYFLNPYNGGDNGANGPRMDWCVSVSYFSYEPGFFLTSTNCKDITMELTPLTPVWVQETGDQQFQLTAGPQEGLVKLTARHSLHCLTAGAQAVTQEICDDTAAQSWTLEQVPGLPDGWMSIKSAATGNCFSLQSAAEWAPVVMVPCNPADGAQIWALEQQELLEGVVKIQVTANAIPEPVPLDPVVPEPVPATPVIPEPVPVEPVVPEPAPVAPVIPEPVPLNPIVPEPTPVDPVVPVEPVVPEPEPLEPITPGPVVADIQEPIVIPAPAPRVPAVPEGGLLPSAYYFLSPYNGDAGGANGPRLDWCASVSYFSYEAGFALTMTGCKDLTMNLAPKTALWVQETGDQQFLVGASVFQAGQVKISARHSLLCLTAGAALETKITQEVCADTAAQSWSLEQVPALAPGWLSIKSAAIDACIGIEAESAAEWAAPVLVPCDPTKGAQVWALTQQDVLPAQR